MVKRPFDVETRLRELATGRRSPQFEMRITADGAWHYQGSPIGREALVRLFSTALHRDEDGGYWLVTPFEAGRVEVEDAPFTIVELAIEASSDGRRIVFRDNLDNWLTLDARHPLVMREPATGGHPAPYVTLRPGFEAKVARPVFYELAELAEPDPATGLLGVRSAGCFFALEGSTAAC